MKFRFGRFEICRNMSLKHGPEDMGRKAVWINFRILVILEIVRVSADYHVPAGFLVGLGQKSRRDRDWESHNPPNRGCRGLGWV